MGLSQSNTGSQIPLVKGIISKFDRGGQPPLIYY